MLDRTDSSLNILSQVKNCFSDTPSIDMTDGSQEEKTSVENWASAIKNCKFFITDSFHGACFAIIFNKPFICIVNKSRGESRFKSLFKTFGLENRCVYENVDITDIISQQIDYQSVNAIIQNEVQRSKDWLLNAINTEKNKLANNANYDMIEMLQSEIEELQKSIADINYLKLKYKYM